MLRRWQAVSAVCSSNLGKRGRRDSRFRRTLPAVGLMSIVRSKKSNRAVGKLLLIPDACHIDNPPRHHLAHSARMGGPGALASRLEGAYPRPHRGPQRMIATIQFTGHRGVPLFVCGRAISALECAQRSGVRAGARGSAGEYASEISGPRGRRSNHHITRSDVSPRRASCTHCAARKPSKASGISRCQPSARPACIATLRIFGSISAVVP